MSASLKAIHYRGYRIQPKLDFGPVGYLVNGKYVKKGYVVTDGVCNVMPGATWFQTVSEARKAVDILIAVGGENASELMWEIMHGLPAFPGQKVAPQADCIATRGRFTWKIAGGVVTELEVKPRALTGAQVVGLRKLIARRPKLGHVIFSLGLRFPTVMTLAAQPAS